MIDLHVNTRSEKLTEKICGWRIHLNSAIVYLQQAPFTASSENVPDSQSSADRRKYYHLLKQNVLSVHIRKNTHYLILSNQIFGKYLGTTERTYRICVVKTRKNVGLVSYLAILSWFLTTKTVLVYFFKYYYKRKKIR